MYYNDVAAGKAKIRLKRSGTEKKKLGKLKCYICPYCHAWHVGHV
jgi:hypothetical protein